MRDDPCTATGSKWRDAVLWARIKTFGHSSLSYPGRIVMVAMIALLALGFGLVYHALDHSDAVRNKRACASYAADLALFEEFGKLHLHPQQRAVVTAAIATKVRLIASLHCPRH